MWNIFNNTQANRPCDETNRQEHKNKTDSLQPPEGAGNEHAYFMIDQYSSAVTDD